MGGGRIFLKIIGIGNEKKLYFVWAGRARLQKKNNNQREKVHAKTDLMQFSWDNRIRLSFLVLSAKI